ncbi:MAG: hypothetical protein JWN04_5315 [Myxococcaceae bacterium]|nr:hypothetical protein [Myxococcaceae bacterium]
MKNAFLLGVTMLVLGCAQTSGAMKEVESALAAVHNAQAAGAAQNPASAPKLTQAENEIARAQTLLESGKTGTAKTSAATAYQYAQEALQLLNASSGAAPAAAPAAP